MKNRIRNLGALACFGVMLFSANIAVAQTATTTTTTSTRSIGTISAFSPDAIVVKTTTSSSPVSFSSTKTTTYVDENGNPVSIETVKSGLPVTVFYDKDGDKMVASKVVIKKTVSTEPLETPVTSMTTTRSTTTTSAGTISEFGPSTLVVKSESAPEPLTYSYTKTTSYVDEAGNPVSIETVKSGLPVTVYYDTVDGKMVANKVVVRKTTTTTTTPNP